MYNVVSLVTYNGLEECRELLDQLHSYDEIDLIIIGVGKAIREFHEVQGKVTISSSLENLGYSRGHNRNFQNAKIRFPDLNFRFIVLNNDITIVHGFSAFISSARAGIMSAPVVKLSDIEYGYGRKFDAIFGRNKWNKSALTNPDWISGCALNVSAADYNRVMFDEKFFIYAEDLKLCLTLRNKVNFTIVSEACVQHYSTSFEAERSKKRLYRSILSYRNNKIIASDFARIQLSYRFFNFVRFTYKLLKIFRTDRRTLKLFIKIHIKDLTNKEVVEFIHDEFT